MNKLFHKFFVYVERMCNTACRRAQLAYKRIRYSARKYITTVAVGVACSAAMWWSRCKYLESADPGKTLNILAGAGIVGAVCWTDMRTAVVCAVVLWVYHIDNKIAGGKS